MVCTAGVTDYLEVLQSVFVVGLSIASKNGHSEVFISSHLEVTLSFTDVDTVACVARVLIEKE